MIHWQWQAFAQLDGAALYQALELRQQVFILEQRCLYADIDGYDLDAWHLLGWRSANGRRELAAYLRCLAPGAKFPEMSLGRVLTAPGPRGLGFGKLLLAEAIAHATRQFPGHAIRIGAQHHLERFYQGFGFQTISAPYDDEGIPHVDMLRHP